MPKEPIKISEIPAKERSRNFDEVVTGYSEEQVLQEASRCIQCKNPKCVAGCPVGINIPEFIRLIAEGRVTIEDGRTRIAED